MAETIDRFSLNHSFYKALNKNLLAVKYEGKLYKLNSNKYPYQFIALRTLERKTSVPFIRDVLGVTDYTQHAKPKKISPQVEAAAINVSQTTPAVENIELQNLGDTIDQVGENVKLFETVMHEAGVRTGLEQKDVGVETDVQMQQNLRNLERTHQFISTMSGQIKASAAKISILDEQITQLTRERDRIAFLGEDIEDGRIEEINEELKELRKKVRSPNTTLE